MGMDTEEMYRRGVADAERGDPHPFYYQHYYQYRRGYDRTRRNMGLAGGFEDLRRRRRLRLLAAAALLAVVAAVFFWRERVPALTTRTPQPPSAAPAPTAAPTRTPIFPTPTPEPTPTPVALHVGGAATIANTQGAPLRGRQEPGTKAPITASFKEGEQVRILEGPVEADGFSWWRIEGPSGTGWSAERSREGTVWLQPSTT